MKPSLWQPPVALSVQEAHIMKRIRKAQLFVFLRQHRHEVLDEAFQQELANLYRKTERVQPLSMVDKSASSSTGLTKPCDPISPS